MELLPLHFTSRIRNIRTESCHKQAGAWGYDIQQSIPSPTASLQWWADATSQLSSSTEDTAWLRRATTPGISGWQEHGGKNVQVCHPWTFQKTLRKNSKCPKKESTSQGSQQKGLEGLFWFVRWMPCYCLLFRQDQIDPNSLPSLLFSQCLYLCGDFLRHKMIWNVPSVQNRPILMYIKFCPQHMSTYMVSTGITDHNSDPNPDI